LVAVGALVLIELGLQVAAMLAPSRTSAWREGAEHRILCVGDSHTWGALVPRAEAYPSHLERLLDLQTPGTYSVINLGLPGMNTSQLRTRLPVWLSRYQPEVVVVWAGVNNLWNVGGATEASGSVWFESLALRSRLYRFVRVWLHDRELDRYVVNSRADRLYAITNEPRVGEHHKPFVTRHDGIIEEIQHERVREGLSETDLLQEAGARAERDLAAIAELSQAAGVELVFILYPIPVSSFQTSNLATRRIAERYGVPFVDAAEAVARIPEEEQEWLWGAHPSGLAYEEVARDLVPLVRDLAEGSSRAP